MIYKIKSSAISIFAFELVSFEFSTLNQFNNSNLFNEIKINFSIPNMIKQSWIKNKSLNNKYWI